MTFHLNVPNSLLDTNDSQNIAATFQFSDYSSDDEDTFEDSREIQSEDEFLAPINFSSVFGRKQAARSTSTPNIAKNNKSKRGASSPMDSSINPKKPRSKSLIPVKN